MNPSRLFIERPVATVLLMLAVLGSGIFAYRMLAVSALPEVDYPTIQVTTLFPGASPRVMSDAVTAPLERTLGQMSGLSQMYSTSSAGASVITLRFDLALPLDEAEQEVQAAINSASNLLPNDLPDPPTYRKVNPADSPVLILAASSDSMPLTEVQDLINTRIALKLSQVSGVGLVTLAGGHQAAVRISANPLALAAHGLSLQDVYTAVNDGNVNGSKGGFDGKYRSIMLDANDQLRSASEYAGLILKYENGAPLRLGDVATIEQAPENQYQAATANGKPAILIKVQRQPGANVIKVVDQIKALLPSLREGLPGSVKIETLSDRTETIRASVHDVQFELLLSIALVVMVTFLFLRSVVATFIPGVAVPLSLVATFGVMYLCGFSVDNMSLMALTIATGFVIDDAIVMVENISRHLEAGEKPLQAAFKGSREIAFTIVSLTVSLVAVLIPLLFMQDVVGRLFREFAITLAAAIVVSMLVSLSLTPMLCGHLLRHIPKEKEGRFQRWGTLQFDRLVAVYDRALVWVLDHQRLTLLVALATFVLTTLLYLYVPKGFFPPQDNGLIEGTTVASQNVSFAEMARRQADVVQRILKDPAVASVASTIGVDGVNGTLNSGRLQIELKPYGERDEPASEVVRRLQTISHSLSGMDLYLVAGQDLTVDDRITASQYQFTLDDLDSERLYDLVPKLVAELRQQPALTHVVADLQNQGRVAYVHLDRAVAGRYGITAADVNTALYNAFGQRLISTIFTQANQYRVVLQVPSRFRQGPEALHDVYLTGSNGQMVRLTDVARIEQRTAPLQITRLDQMPAVGVSFDLADGYSLEDAQTAISQAMTSLDPDHSVRLQYQGAASAFQRATGNTLWLILAALLTMYVVLGVLYESFIHPLTILSTLPPAAIGALLALVLTGTEFTLFALIGIILLIGIVKKNAILMIDFALQARRHQGLNAHDAIHRACLLRLRPILMTTMAALLGALPLMLASGTGAELRQPLGLVIVGGLLLSQLLTLFTTPVIYLMFERLSERLRRRFAGNEPDDSDLAGEDEP